MNKKKLFKDLSVLGLPLMEVEDPVDVNATLVQVVKSENVRLWEGFPLLLTNCSQLGLFDYTAVMGGLRDRKEKETFKQLVLLSLAFYKSVKVEFFWANLLLKKAGFTKTEFERAYKNFMKKDVKGLYGGVSRERMEVVFQNYYKGQKEDLNNLSVTKGKFNLEYSLSQVFSPKQRELFFKKLKREKLTKTEKEYYSRVVKKKVLALANEELHDLAKKMVV